MGMVDRGTLHEDLQRSQSGEAGSDRSFGIVFAVVFAIVGLLPLVHGGTIRPWALVIAGAFLVVALTVPRILKPANQLWYRFGRLLHGIVTPVILGLMFFSTVTPMALIMRLMGKKPLALRFEPERQSYWIRRDPPGPAPETMKNQF